MEEEYDQKESIIHNRKIENAINIIDTDGETPYDGHLKEREKE